MTLRLAGECNDYIGKGLSGGKIIVVPKDSAKFVPEENVIVGNVAFYGAVYGEAFIRGVAGERFCVRNSGISAVVEGIGDHGCEYMTGGTVVVLGKTGRNFAAGMSGGVAYVYDKDGSLEANCNQGLVSLESVKDTEDAAHLYSLIEKHAAYTGSTVAAAVLEHFDTELPYFVKVIPNDYKRVMEIMKAEKANGADADSAALAAFETVAHKKVAM